MSVSSPEKTKVYKKKRSSKQSLFLGNTEVKSMFHIFSSTMLVTGSTKDFSF